jgi:hypothetical protein
MDFLLHSCLSASSSDAVIRLIVYRVVAVCQV